MTYNAVVENRDGEGFWATVLGWPACTAVASTREEALAKLREALRDRLSKAEIVPLEVDAPEDVHPWAKFAGMFKDDPLFDRVEEDIEAYRRTSEPCGSGRSASEPRICGLQPSR